MNTHRQILVTGATGALGPALAAELARTAAADRIAVLMRGEPVELAARFENWLRAVGDLLAPEEQGCLARLFPASGDISRDGLGLAQDGKAGDLRSETDVIIHAAADTNFAGEPQRQWN